SEPKPPVAQTPPSEPKPPVAQTPPSEPKPPVAQTPPSEPKPPVAQTPPSEPKPPVAQTPPSEPQPPLVQTPPEPKPPVAEPPRTQDAPVASGNRPLLIPGKKTLFQRVVLGPGAALFDAPGGRQLHALDPFAIYYVYERRSVGGGTWLRIGGASDGRAEGWMDGSKGYDWRQTLTLKFTERSGRDPVMFFGERAPLENLFVQSDARQVVRDWQKKIAAAKGSAVPGVPVVALEPAATAIADQRFYLLPIFDHTETFGADGQPLSLLQVATVDPGAAAPPAAAPPAADAFRTGVVFVFDTTRSMNPYLDRARTAIRKIYDRLAREKLTDKVGIGLVAFRSSVTKTPGLEYVSRVFEPLSPATTPAQVMSDAQQIVATEVSSHSFNEDAFAGVMDAVERMDWKPYGARVAILITDAGALRKNDPLGATQMNEAEVRAAALAKGVHLIVLHLKTPAGRNNHASAETQYRTLAADPNPQIGSLYVPVSGGDVGAFGDAVETIVGKLVDIVRDTAAGQDAPAPDIDAGYAGVADKTAALGYALRMDFLGAKTAARPPGVVSAWVADRDPARPDVPSFQVCVLLTKLQLNDLQQGLKTIVESARRAQKSPKDFFQEVASASASFTRGQETKTPRNLYATGLLGEFLDGLPYKSKVLNLTEDLWLSWSVAEQEDFIQELESKIRLYETYHNDTANWVRFGDADPGDALYRVPLATLP
ncbi:MAG TPA: serine/threonine protein kinase, partial [Plasticicumulans sp.]|nr:serine/threonine protein kinase [Plasticicumulans sp.]